MRDSAFLERMDVAQRHLAERGASSDVVTYVTDLLVQQHQQYHQSMAAEVDKRHALLEFIKQLEVRVCVQL